MAEIKWSKVEKGIAKRAFDAARDRETLSVANEVKSMAGSLQDPYDAWRIHDYLTEKGKEMNQKYDYRYSMLLLIFPRLIREGWLELDELDGLAEDKLEIIRLTLGLADKQ